ncbi:RNA polymerase recycling motor HelD [Salirhabdus salicampi]|uniref:RNA polymerase recycling motor HelD n=1 Tax=Salirhabdus salicampi TaxID=476102 RepID=UPI0020C29CCE|nr:RNA polymerase recycling motor HelD [Salirhabdus salicampi]MCP8615357.1 AAA family ATPase [Salirhabdus salicampi]
MSLYDHPDYDYEYKRLEFTKRFIQAVIKTSKENESKFKQNIKTAFEDLDWLDSSLSYINILTNANFLSRSEAEINNLERIKDKPYFAKIHFKRENQEKTDEYYIGKTSLYQRDSQEPLIIDWRSPVANVYYDGRLGEVSYTANGKDYVGDLQLKRQFVMEDGSLQDIRDVDVTTTDELLQQSLSESASNRLTDIVATIQEEQNRIIRADLKRPIIVQGAAGSGKTTIALHRISYFIYQYANQFKPEELMILAPNHIFIDYISEALPDLGVDRVKQTTFTTFAKECLGKNLKLVEDDKITLLLDDDTMEKEFIRWCSSLKGSLQFKSILDRYIQDIQQSLYPVDDFKVDKFRLFSAKKMKRLFTKEYRYLPIYKRIEKMKKVVQNDYRLKKKKMIERVTDFYDEKLDKGIYDIKDRDKRRKYVTKVMNRKEQRLEELKSEMKGAVQTYFKKQFPKKTLIQYYKMLFEDPEQLIRYSEGSLTKHEAEKVCSYTNDLLKKNKYEMEDLAPLLYLQQALFGITDTVKIKSVIIDEAQDYSYLQLIALKEALGTDLFTIVGDLSQGIHSYRGIKDWNVVVDKIFPRATYTELQKSYRTTVEIMNLANAVIEQLPEDLPKVRPIVRHGEKPRFHYTKNINQMRQLIHGEVECLKNDGFKTFAVIGKTFNDCRTIYKALKAQNKKVQLIEDKEEKIHSDHIIVIPSHISKGLEFDVVFVISNKDTYSKNNEMDIKLLYVSMTRPLHRLLLLGNKPVDLLLGDVDQSILNIQPM